MHDVPGLAGLYGMDDNGDFYNLNQNRKLKPSVRRGTLKVGFNINGKRTYFAVEDIKLSIKNKCSTIIKQPVRTLRKRGVNKGPNGMWIARITVDGEQTYLGCFEDKEVAYSKVYERYVEEFGEKPW